MRALRSFYIGGLLATIVVATSAIAASNPDLDAAMGYDGLQKITVKGIDIAYARPGASLAVYTKIMIDPIEVAFHKDWNPNRTGSPSKLSKDERENIRSGIAKIVYDAFVKEMQKGGGYQVVDGAGPDVLRVRANIVNVFVTAPDTMTPGRTRVYTVSAGEGTIIAELYDSETGEILARVIDRREARTGGPLRLTNSVVNAQEANLIASSWARILRTRLDAAHGIGKK